MLYRYIILILCSLSFDTAYAEVQQSAVASAHPLATEAGMNILQQGGNAFDAAVAVTAALAVVEPAGSGLGGGGFWLLHRHSDQLNVMVDGREMAPAQADVDMYLDENGEFKPDLSLNGPYASGIPGVPAALVHLSQFYGSLPLEKSLAPAIRYAEDGFEISSHYQRLVDFRKEVLKKYPSSSKIFLERENTPNAGFKLIQSDLANTLKSIAKQGRAGFYQGEVAAKLVKSVQQADGLWTLDDLRQYQIKERRPVKTEFAGYKVTSAALPSSGGIVLTSILNQLSLLAFEQADQAQRKHLLIEAMRRAYHDRALYLGDADFVSIPPKLTTLEHAKKLIEDINADKATPSKATTPVTSKGENTTHFSIIDNQGNRVAATLSINYPFGSGFVAEGTGVLLNNEMDDFSAKPGEANVYGLVGNQANAIEAYKRPLSSMTPTFIENDDRLLITGTPGGSRIISMVLLSVIQFIEGYSAQQIVAAPRFHHQYLPDEVQIENVGFTDDEINDLKRRGHQINQLNRQYGNMQVIVVDKESKQITAASDPRGEGLSLVQ